MIQSDLFRCIHLSSSPIGITGNCSFSEALVISDKLPFYDTKVVYPPRYSWDRDLSTYRFWQSVVTLADRLVIGDDVSKKAFIHYLLTGEGLTPETLPCFQAYWQTVRNHILTHCDVAPYLSGLLHRAACLHEHPDLKDAEAAIARQLHQGTLTEEEAVSALRQKLKPYYPSML